MPRRGQTDWRTADRGSEDADAREPRLTQLLLIRKGPSDGVRSNSVQNWWLHLPHFRAKFHRHYLSGRASMAGSTGQSGNLTSWDDLEMKNESLPDTASASNG